jgi:DNA-binding protein Fis
MNEGNVDIVLEDILSDAFFLDPQNEMSRFVKGLEKKLILSVLKKVNGNQKEAAGLLGIKYTTLNEKIRRYKILPLRREEVADATQSLGTVRLFAPQE